MGDKIILQNCYCYIYKERTTLGSELQEQDQVVQRADNATQRISVNKRSFAIHRKGIFPVDSVLQSLNNRGQLDSMQRKSHERQGESSSLFPKRMYSTKKRE